jgi:Rod binding domain-containing protein
MKIPAAGATSALTGKAPVSPVAGALGSDGKAPAEKVKEVAKDFESLLLGELLKQSRAGLDKEGGLFAGDKTDSYGALFDFFLGKQLASAGGLGLADYLGQQLTANRAR